MFLVSHISGNLILSPSSLKNSDIERSVSQSVFWLSAKDNSRIDASASVARSALFASECSFFAAFRTVSFFGFAALSRYVLSSTANKRQAESAAGIKSITASAPQAASVYAKERPNETVDANTVDTLKSAPALSAAIANAGESIGETARPRIAPTAIPKITPSLLVTYRAAKNAMNIESDTPYTEISFAAKTAKNPIKAREK